MRDRIRWLAILAVFALVVTACGDDDDAVTTTAATATTAATTTVPPKAPIRVPAINMEDGVTAFPDERKGVEAILAWYNANGGLDGHPLELDLCTAGDDPESIQICAQKFANDDDALFVQAIMALNSAPLYEEFSNAGKPIIGQLLFDVPDMTAPDVFSIDIGTLAAVDVLFSFAVPEYSLESLGIVVNDDEVGNATAGFVADFLASFGVESTIVTYDATVPDLVPVFSAAGLDTLDGLVFVPTSPEDCVPAARALNTLGFEGKKLGGDQCTAQDYLDTGDFDGWVFVVASTLAVHGHPERVEVEQIFADFNGPPLGGFVAATALEAFYLIEILEAAYAAAGNDVDALTTEIIRQAALSVDGPVKLGPDIISCPGVEPFVAACAPAGLLVEAEGTELRGISEWVYSDMAKFAE